MAAHTARQAARRSSGSATPGDGGLALMVTGRVVARAQAGVFDHRPWTTEAVQVAGLGQDRGRADGRQAGDRADQLGQTQLVEDGHHERFGVDQPRPSAVPVLYDHRCSLERTGPVGGHSGGVGPRPRGPATPAAAAHRPGSDRAPRRAGPAPATGVRSTRTPPSPRRTRPPSPWPAPNPAPHPVARPGTTVDVGPTPASRATRPAS